MKKSDDEAGEGKWREGGNRSGKCLRNFLQRGSGKLGGKWGSRRPHFPDAPTWKIAATQLPSDTNYEISSVSRVTRDTFEERGDRCSVKSWDTIAKRSKNYFLVRNVEVKARSFMEAAHVYCLTVRIIFLQMQLLILKSLQEISRSI